MINAGEIIHADIIQAQTLQHYRPDKHSTHAAIFFAFSENRYKCKVYRFKPCRPVWIQRIFSALIFPAISHLIWGGYFSPERDKQNPKLPKLSNSRHPSNFHIQILTLPSFLQTHSTQQSIITSSHPISPHTPKPFYPKTNTPN